MRATASRLKAAGRKDIVVQQFQPARLFIRCSFCNIIVSSAPTLGNVKRKGKVRNQVVMDMRGKSNPYSACAGYNLSVVHACGL